MVYAHNHLALAQIEVVEQFDTIEHGAARHPPLAHDLDHFALRSARGPFLADSRSRSTRRRKAVHRAADAFVQEAK
jgi:hypothetical protein